jgi:hypothetical protein
LPSRKRGAARLGYELDPSATNALRQRVNASLEQFGGDGSEVDDELARRLESSFRDLGLQIAGKALASGVQYRDLPRERAERPGTITQQEFFAFLDKLCPGFWPIC